MLFIFSVQWINGIKLKRIKTDMHYKIFAKDGGAVEGRRKPHTKATLNVYVFRFPFLFFKIFHFPLVQWNSS